MSIDSVTSELRTLRARLDARRVNTHVWPTKEEEDDADLARYDRRLLKAAAILRLEGPPVRSGDGFLLGDDDRGRLERRLAEAGLDIRASADEGPQG